jgi:RimJ/RimL family protein N-acetyltransferase
VLRPWRQEEAEWYVEARDEEILSWTTEPRELTSAAVRRAIESLAAAPSYAGLAIVDRTSGELLGNISLVPRESQTAEISYWLAAAARGRGAASDAVRTLCSWGCEAWSMSAIMLRTRMGNTASQRVAHSCGFVVAEVRDEEVCFSLKRARDSGPR